MTSHHSDIDPLHDELSKRHDSMLRLNAALEEKAASLERAIAAAQAAQAQAEHAGKTCEELLTIVSHDLRNPLSSITTGVALLERIAGDDEFGQRARKYTQTIARSADRMNRLVNDLLDFANIREGRMQIEREAVSARGVVDESVELLKGLAVDKRLRLEGSAPEGLLVHGQRDRILQILANLVGNAIKFTPAGGTIAIQAWPGDGVATFAVIDTGIGIADAEIPHLFDRFWQGRRAKGRDGFGLGLFIVQGLVEAHQGHVRVESRVGLGSSFYFTVPLAESPSPTRHGDA
jgi:signal transduction histidine kinase